MRLLFVAMPESIHTARWLAQLAGDGHDVHLFPTGEAAPHRLLRDTTLYSFGARRPPGLHRSVRVRGIWPARRGAAALPYYWRKSFRTALPRAGILERVIRRLRPDVVHSLETQHSGYLALAARQRVRDFPTWIHSTWGSDLQLFPPLPEHSDRIGEVLGACDYLHTDCRRDLHRAGELGFAGGSFGVFPVCGGFDLAHIRRFRSVEPPSARRTVLLKGVQNWTGRALVALRALERCAGALAGYGIEIVTTAPEVDAAAALTARSTGLRITTHRGWLDHEQVLRIQGRSRLAIGLGISDGTPVTMLEAMVAGALPVQSSTAATDEWLTPGRNGLVVQPEDPDDVAAAIVRALSDDALVDEAAAENERIADERLDLRVVRPQILKQYRMVERECGAGATRRLIPMRVRAREA